jgi:hypothetical protein
MPKRETLEGMEWSEIMPKRETLEGNPDVK